MGYMKKISEKICLSALLALLLSGLLFIPAQTAYGSGGDGIDEDMRMNLINTAESLSQAIVELGQEEIDAYKESGDAFTVSAMEAWEGSRDELGDFKGLGQSEVEKVTNGYSVRIPAGFSRQDAEFVYVYDQTGAPTSFNIDIQYPMQVLLQRAGLNTLMGLGIVFAMLLFLTFVISLFRFIGKAEEKPQTEVEDLPTPVQSQIQMQKPLKAAQPAKTEMDDRELVAVIAAAIAAYEGTSTDGFVVRSIRRADRRRARW